MTRGWAGGFYLGRRCGLFGKNMKTCTLYILYFFIGYWFIPVDHTFYSWWLVVGPSLDGENLHLFSAFGYYVVYSNVYI